MTGWKGARDKGVLILALDKQPAKRLTGFGGSDGFDSGNGPSELRSPRKIFFPAIFRTK
jgi:hypothetical protein